MKLKEGFVLGQIAGENVVLPSGDGLDLTKMISLNDTGKFIWECLEKETTQEQIVDAILAEYNVSREKAAEYVADFVKELEMQGFLEA